LKGWKFLALICSSVVLLSLLPGSSVFGKEGEGGENAEQAQLERAQQLYDEAVSFYKEGQLEQAQAKFVQVKEVPVDIGEKMRASVDKYLTRIEEKLRERAEEARVKEAVDILEQAENLFSAEKYAEAKPLYIKVEQMNVDLGWRRNRTLRKRLASIDDMIAAKRAAAEAEAEAEAAKAREAQAMQMLMVAFEQGEKLYEAGNYAGAKAQFEKVMASELSLGRSINSKISSYMKGIAEKEKQAARLAELDASYVEGDKLFKAGDFQGAIELFRQVERARDADEKLRLAAKDYRERAEAKLGETKQRDKLLARLDEADELLAAGEFEKALKVTDGIEAAGISLGTAGDLRLKNCVAAAKQGLRTRDQQLEHERLQAELAEKQEAERLAAERKGQEDAQTLYDKAASLYSQREYQAAKEVYLSLEGKAEHLSSRQNKTVAKRLSTIDGLIVEQRAENEAKAAFERGESLYNAGSYAEARTYLEAVKASGVDLGRSINRRVASYLDDIDEKEAAAATTQEYVSMLARGVELQNAGNYESAIAMFERVEQAKAAGSDLRGKARDHREQAQAKLKDLEKQTREAESLAAQRAQEEEAARIEAERKQKQDTEDTYVQARKLYQEGRLEEARALFEKVRSSGVSLGAKTDQRVVAYIADIEKDLAARREQDQKRAAVDAAYRQGVSLLEQGQYEDALVLFQQVSDSSVDMTRDERNELKSLIARAEDGVAAVQAEREAQARAKGVQDRLAAAGKLIDDGKPLEARAELDALIASGVPLTFEDERAIGELSQRIVQQLPPAQREAVTVPAPRARGKSDFRRQYNALWEALIQEEEIRRQERQFRAEALLEESIALIEQQQFPAALGKLEEATELDPELQEAQDKKVMVQEILSIPPAYRPLSAEVSMMEQVARQQARIEVENNLASAKDLYAKKKYDEAEDVLRRVLEMISVLPAGVDMPQEQSQAQSLLDKTISERAAAERALTEQKRLDAQREAERYAKERRETERQRIGEMLKTARDYFENKEYGKAETYCRIILEKDPENPNALALLEVSKEAMLSLARKELSREGYFAHEELEVQSKAKEIPLVESVIEYPSLDEWEKKDARRPPAVIEQDAPGPLQPFDKYPEYPVDTRVLPRPMTFQTEIDAPTTEDLLLLPVSLEVTAAEMALEEYIEGTPIREVLDDIALQTGLNIFLPNTLMYQGERLAEVMSPAFYLVDVPAGVLLDFMLDPYGFGYQIAADNTLVVVPKQDSSKLITRQYDCNHILVNFTDFPTGDADAFMFTGKTLVDLTTLANWIQTNVAPGTWATPPAAVADPQAQVPGSVRVGTIQQLDTWGTLIIRQTADVHAQIEDFLSALSETIDRLMVVSLEIRILTLADSTVRKIGVEWKGLDIAGDSFVDEGFVSERSDVTSDFRFGATPTLPLFGSLDTGPTAGIDYSIIQDWAARVVVELAERIQGSEAVQAPRVTLMQNQVGYISLNDQRPYVTSLTTDVSEDAVGITPTIAFLDIGVTFQAVATISADRKYVFLTLAPTFTELRDFVTSKAIAVTGNTSSEVEQTTPITTTTNVRTTVKVPDGGALVIGGLVRSSSTDAESRVPLVNHIPIIGNLFRSHGRGGERTTIIIMITPHIVDYAEYEADIEFYGKIAPSKTPKPAEPVESVGTLQIGG